MKTSSNNNNIESNNQEFFTKGKKYRCIRDVVMKKGGKTAFKAGSIYEQTNEPTYFVGWLRNEQGERHGWPQPVYIADEVKTWGTKPEDIDPRLYFEPVEEITEDIKVGDMVRHNQSNEVAKVVGIRKGNSCALGLVTLYKLDFGKSVKGAFGFELNGGEFVAEAFTPLERTSEISDPDGREFKDFTAWNGKTVTAEERQKWTKFFAEGISNKVKFEGKESTYKHNAGKIRVMVAYENGTDKPEDMSYCVSWYRWTNTESEKAEIVECDNGVSIWEAARDMADFHLLADVVGLQTIDEILNPCERPQAA